MKAAGLMRYASFEDVRKKLIALAARQGVTRAEPLAAPDSSRHSKPEASPVVLRRDGQQAQEAAAHCLLRT